MKVLTLRRWLLVMLALLVLLAATIVGATVFGSTQGVALSERLSFWQARWLMLKGLLGLMPGSVVQNILWDLRLPRILLAAVVGAGLAISGGTFQAMLRNPLADPYILGVSGGASVGAVVAIVFHLDIGRASMMAVPIFAFAGALGTMMLVYWIALTRGRLQPYVLLMVGVIVNAVLGAVIMYLSTIAQLAETNQVFFWLMGGIREDAQYWQILVIFVFAACGSMMLIRRAGDYNLLTLGEESSRQLGVNVERAKLIGFVGASLVTGAVVSMSGPIGFVGLIVPHLVRLMWGPDHRLLLPACVLVGAIFLVVSDTAARVLGVQVGVVTAFCGGPFFLVLLKRQRAAG